MRRLFIVDDQASIEVNCNHKLDYRSFLLSVFEENDYVEENKELLIDWVNQYNQFPLTVFISAYDEMYEEIDAQLIELAN